MTRPVRLLGLSGSLRSGSYNTALLGAAAELLPAGAELEVADLGSLPLFNDDLVPEVPAPVRELTDRVRAADGLVLASPEYNGGVTGVLKNALDWLSVPAAESSLRRKHVALLGASPGMLGTARSQTQLRNILTMCGSVVVTHPEVLVAHAHERFDEEMRLADDAARRLLGTLLGRLVREVGEGRQPALSRGRAPGPAR